jgi:hypothetical protein
MTVAKRFVGEFVSTDEQIDCRVYDFYALTEDEICIV